MPIQSEANRQEQAAERKRFGAAEFTAKWKRTKGFKTSTQRDTSGGWREEGSGRTVPDSYWKHSRLWWVPCVVAEMRWPRQQPGQQSSPGKKCSFSWSSAPKHTALLHKRSGKVSSAESRPVEVEKVGSRSAREEKWGVREMSLTVTGLAHINKSAPISVSRKYI